MKKFICVLFALGVFAFDMNAQEYKVVTSVESIVPMGIGRSRIISAEEKVNVDNYTTERVDGKTSKQTDVKRSDAKIENLEETKLLNFYSGVGINFQNIASNDAIVTAKLNQLAEEGWELVFVASGVESVAGKDDRTGIFITRYIFKRDK